MENVALRAELLKGQIINRINFDDIEAEEIAINYVHEVKCWRGRYWERHYSLVAEG